VAGDNINTDVLILCGGLGKRLKKINKGRPKPMMPLGERPLLDIIIGYFSGFGFRRFILATGYRAGFIKKYYRDKPRGKISIAFSDEKKPLDTGGAVKNAKRLIKSRHFFVINGDSFCKFNPGKFLVFHKKNRSFISILLKNVSIGKEYGAIGLENNGRISRFNEKSASARKCFINAGVYIFDKASFDFMPSCARFSLERDFFPRMLSKRVFGYKKCGFFIDIGTPEKYQKANKYFSN